MLQALSNVLIDWLTADWEINSFLLASENERELGQPLFIRSTKKVQLTPAGALLLKHVEPCIIHN